MTDKKKTPKRSTRLRVDWDFIDRAMPSNPSLTGQRLEASKRDGKSTAQVNEELQGQDVRKRALASGSAEDLLADIAPDKKKPSST